MAFPLAERELTLRGRNKWMYVLRAAMGSITCAFIMIYFLVSGFGNHVASETVGRGLIGIASTYQFAAALLLPPFLGASLIAREKQERTLGLLLLANMRGGDVYLAKLLSAFMPVATLIAGALPVLAFAAIFGGITVETILIQVGLFLITAMAATSLTLFCSTASKNTGSAMIASVILIAISLTALPLLDAPVEGATKSSPIELHPAYAAMRLAEPGLPSWFWMPGAAVGLGVTLVSTLLTIPLLPRQAYDRPAKRPRRLPTLKSRRRRNVGANPTARILALGAPGFSSAMFTSDLLKLFASLLLAAIAFLPCIGILFVAALAAYDVLTSMDVARRSGVMDDIRLTAPGPKQLVRDIFRSQYRRCLFYLPAFMVGGGLGSTLMIGTLGAGALSSTTNSTIGGWIAVAVGLLTAAAIGLCQVYLIVGIACFESRVRAKPGSRALICMAHYLGWITALGAVGYFGILATVLFGVAFENKMSAVAALLEPILPFLLAIGSAALFGGFYLLCGHMYRKAFERAYEKFV